MPYATIEEAAFLTRPFAVDIHIGQENDPRRSFWRTGSRAYNLIRYSCRPHFELARAILLPGDILSYHPYGTRFRHRVPAKDAITTIRTLEPLLKGRDTHTHY
jgi:hypothetical protein